MDKLAQNLAILKGELETKYRSFNVDSLDVNSFKNWIEEFVICVHKYQIMKANSTLATPE